VVTWRLVAVAPVAALAGLPAVALPGLPSALRAVPAWDIAALPGDVVGFRAIPLHARFATNEALSLLVRCVGVRQSPVVAAAVCAAQRALSRPAPASAATDAASAQSLPDAPEVSTAAVAIAEPRLPDGDRRAVRAVHVRAVSFDGRELARLATAVRLEADITPLPAVAATTPNKTVGWGV
jgi:hypothetical protein